MTAAFLPTHTLRSRIEMINEKLAADKKPYTLKMDIIAGVNVHDADDEFLFTLPSWAMEDVDTAHLVTLAMAEAYTAGWDDGHWVGSQERS